MTQEELKEALLAYLCCHAPDSACDNAADLKGCVESYLRERCGVEVEYDAEDGLETLTRLKLLAGRTPLRAIPPAAALAQLRQHWHDRRSERYHFDCASASAAQTKTAAPAGQAPPL